MALSRRVFLGSTAAGLVLAACARPAAGELGTILDRLSTDFLRESPEYATSLAVSEEQAGGRSIDRLSDASKEGFCGSVNSPNAASLTSAASIVKG